MSEQSSGNASLNIVLTGFNPDFEDPQGRDPLTRLQAAFGVDPATAQRFLDNIPVVVKRHATKELARTYIQTLHAIGAEVRVEREEPEAAPPEDAQPPEPADEAQEDRSPEPSEGSMDEEPPSEDGGGRTKTAIGRVNMLSRSLSMLRAKPPIQTPGQPSITRKRTEEILNEATGEPSGDLSAGTAEPSSTDLWGDVPSQGWDAGAASVDMPAEGLALGSRAPEPEEEFPDVFLMGEPLSRGNVDDARIGPSGDVFLMGEPISREEADVARFEAQPDVPPDARAALSPNNNPEPDAAPDLFALEGSRSHKPPQADAFDNLIEHNIAIDELPAYGEHAANPRTTLELEDDWDVDGDFVVEGNSAQVTDERAWLQHNDALSVDEDFGPAPGAMAPPDEWGDEPLELADEADPMSLDTSGLDPYGTGGGGDDPFDLGGFGDEDFGHGGYDAPADAGFADELDLGHAEHEARSPREDSEDLDDPFAFSGAAASVQPEEDPFADAPFGDDPFPNQDEHKPDPFADAPFGDDPFTEGPGLMSSSGPALTGGTGLPSGESPIKLTDRAFSSPDLVFGPESQGGDAEALSAALPTSDLPGRKVAQIRGVVVESGRVEALDPEVHGGPRNPAVPAAVPRPREMPRPAERPPLPEPGSIIVPAAPPPTPPDFWESVPTALMAPFSGRGVVWQLVLTVTLFMTLCLSAVPFWLVKLPLLLAVLFVYMGMLGTYFARSVEQGLHDRRTAPDPPSTSDLSRDFVVPGAALSLLAVILFAIPSWTFGLVFEEPTRVVEREAADPGRTRPFDPGEPFFDEKGDAVHFSPGTPGGVAFTRSGQKVLVDTQRRVIHIIGDADASFGSEAGQKIIDASSRATPELSWLGLFVFLLALAVPLLYWPMALTVVALGDNLKRLFDPRYIIQGLKAGGRRYLFIAGMGVVLLCGSFLMIAVLIGGAAMTGGISGVIMGACAGLVPFWINAYVTGAQGQLVGYMLAETPDDFAQFTRDADA